MSTEDDFFRPAAPAHQPAVVSVKKPVIALEDYWKTQCLVAFCRVFGKPEQIWNNDIEIKP